MVVTLQGAHRRRLFVCLWFVCVFPCAFFLGARRAAMGDQDAGQDQAPRAGGRCGPHRGVQDAVPEDDLGTMVAASHTSPHSPTSPADPPAPHVSPHAHPTLAPLSPHAVAFASRAPQNSWPQLLTIILWLIIGFAVASKIRAWYEGRRRKRSDTSFDIPRRGLHMGGGGLARHHAFVSWHPAHFSRPAHLDVDDAHARSR